MKQAMIKYSHTGGCLFGGMKFIKTCKNRKWSENI